MEGKKVEFSRTEQVHVIKPGDLNGGGRLFGGALLQLIDETAGIVAKRHSMRNNSGFNICPYTHGKHFLTIQA